LQIYEGNFHETINDLDRERVTSTLIAWTLAQESAPPNVDVTATIG
jgi:alpha-beta hydrolase superfamily lysophospholipase